MKNNEVHFYTDGACRGNPGPGSCAAIAVELINDKEVVTNLGKTYKEQTTNNEMELMAILMVLEFIEEVSPVTHTLAIPPKYIIFSDSKYSINVLTEWGGGWQCRGWRTSSGKPIKNRDLVIKMYKLLNEYRHDITFKHVRGHSGDKWNEYVDGMCNEVLDSMK